MWPSIERRSWNLWKRPSALKNHVWLSVKFGLKARTRPNIPPKCCFKWAGGMWSWKWAERGGEGPDQPARDRLPCQIEIRSLFHHLIPVNLRWKKFLISEVPGLLYLWRHVHAASCTSLAASGPDYKVFLVTSEVVHLDGTELNVTAANPGDLAGFLSHSLIECLRFFPPSNE